MISAMDDALAMLAPYGPELANGNTNHAPMAAQALCELGRAEAVIPWVDRYRRGLVPRTAPSGRIAADEWRTHLGRAERVADWTAFFENELAEAPWREVAGRWAGRFAPGFSAAAMHGVLRAAHAVRSLEERSTPERLRELAEGLGYWASTYEEIPGKADDGPRMPPREAMASVPIVPPERRRFAGSITSSLAVLAETPEFEPVIGRVDVSGPAAETLSRLTETFARTYLANVHDVLTAIVFIHGVTGTTILRSLLPLVDDETARALARYAWQAGAALYATFARRPFAVETIEPPRESIDELVDLAVAHGDEHAIKFTEACLREHRLAPSPAYLAAARHVLDALQRVT